MPEPLTPLARRLRRDATHAERNVWFETYDNGEWARITQVRDEDSGEWVNSVSLHARPADCRPEQ